MAAATLTYRRPHSDLSSTCKPEPRLKSKPSHAPIVPLPPTPPLSLPSTLHHDYTSSFSTPYLRTYLRSLDAHSPPTARRTTCPRSLSLHCSPLHNHASLHLHPSSRPLTSPSPLPCPSPLASRSSLARSAALPICAICLLTTTAFSALLCRAARFCHDSRPSPRRPHTCTGSAPRAEAGTRLPLAMIHD